MADPFGSSAEALLRAEVERLKKENRELRRQQASASASAAATPTGLPGSGAMSANGSGAGSNVRSPAPSVVSGFSHRKPPAASTKEVADMKAKLGELQRQNAELQREIEDLKRAHSSATSAKDELHQQLSAVAEEVAERELQLVGVARRLHAKLQAQEQELGRLRRAGTLSGAEGPSLRQDAATMGTASGAHGPASARGGSGRGAVGGGSSGSISISSGSITAVEGMFAAIQGQLTTILSEVRRERQPAPATTAVMLPAGGAHAAAASPPAATPPLAPQGALHTSAGAKRERDGEDHSGERDVSAAEARPRRGRRRKEEVAAAAAAALRTGLEGVKAADTSKIRMVRPSAASTAETTHAEGGGGGGGGGGVSLPAALAAGAATITFGDAPMESFLRLAQGTRPTDKHRRALLRSQLLEHYKHDKAAVARDATQLLASLGSTTDMRFGAEVFAALGIVDEAASHCGERVALLMREDALHIDHSGALRSLCRAFIALLWSAVASEGANSDAARRGTRAPLVVLCDAAVDYLRVRRAAVDADATAASRRLVALSQLLAVMEGLAATDVIPLSVTEFAGACRGAEGASMVMLTLRAIVAESVQNYTSGGSDGGGGGSAGDAATSLRRRWADLCAHLGVTADGIPLPVIRDAALRALTAATTTASTPPAPCGGGVDAVLAMRLHLLHQGFAYLDIISGAFATAAAAAIASDGGGDVRYAALLALAITDFGIREDSADWARFAPFFSEVAKTHLSDPTQVLMASAVVDVVAAAATDDGSGNSVAEVLEAPQLDAVETSLRWITQQLRTREMLRAGSGTIPQSGCLRDALSQSLCDLLFSTRTGASLTAAVLDSKIAES